MTRPGVDHVEQQLSNLQLLGHYQAWLKSSREVFGRAITPDSSSSDDESNVSIQPRPMIVVTPPPYGEDEPPNSGNIMELSDQLMSMGLFESDGSSCTETSMSEDAPTPDEEVPLRSGPATSAPCEEPTSTLC
jgi:hypothetical protein